jgi:kynurenine formamidase
MGSKPIPTFGQQTVLTIADFPTNQGTFNLGTLILSEHHGTHLDTAGHYVNTPQSMDKGGIPWEKRKLVHQLGAADLIGRVVLIDISGRVKAELDKNGGKPSPDPKVTDFGEKSKNVITPEDIAEVEKQLTSGVWLLLATGWSKFYFDGIDFAKDPYVNGFNHPGISNAAVDKLIEIEDKKKIRIRGIVSETVGVETGESAKGKDDKWTDSWYAHVRGLQRGWMFVENATNLTQLAMAKPGGCTLVVGAPKHTRGTGGPSRVLAMCRK